RAVHDDHVRGFLRVGVGFLDELHGYQVGVGEADRDQADLAVFRRAAFGVEGLDLFRFLEVGGVVCVGRGVTPAAIEAAVFGFVFAYEIGDGDEAAPVGGAGGAVFSTGLIGTLSLAGGDH